MKFTNIYEEEEDEPEKEDDPKKDDTPEEDDTPDKHHSHKKDTEKHHSHEKSSAKTGDETNITLWVSIVGASLILLMVLLFLKRKSFRKDDM